ncbi:transcriptional regulator MraZ [Clostridia bacterium]|nr:transcriptional regulator MraZ [Clostridia bacterium]
MLGAFSGEYTHSLDGKGRAIIPVNYREKLGQGFAIALNLTRTALELLPAEKWAAQCAYYAALPDTDETAMEYMRMRMASVQQESEMDAQGRVLLPVNLRRAIGLEKDLTFLGMYDRIEIWDAATYEEKMKKTAAQAEAARLAKYVNDNYRPTATASKRD